MQAAAKNIFVIFTIFLLIKSEIVTVSVKYVYFDVDTPDLLFCGAIRESLPTGNPI